MIISDSTKYQANKKKVFLFTIAFIAIVLAYLFIPFHLLFPTKPISGSFYCDMEVTSGKNFISSGYKFSGAKLQNGDYSRSGKYSSFLNKANGNQYGTGFTIPEIKPGQSYTVSVWRFREKGGDDGHLVVSASDGKQFYKGTNKTVKTVSGWELLELNILVPYFKRVDDLKVFFFTEGKYPVYFDDLLIQKTGDPKEDVASESWKPQTIQLQLSDKALVKLNKKRDQALRTGILESADDDWVSSKLTNMDDQSTTKVDLRLKGDWLDHLKDNKWSFRIKTKNGSTFNRLRYFSIHTPSARAYLHEWVQHELFKQEDVLTTYYDFLKVEFNGDKQGIYAIEEHFDKVLLERQNRREGPIVRFSEDGYWEGVKRHIVQVNAIDHDIQLDVKQPEASPITPFQKKKTITTPLLNEQFEQAVQLLEQYKNGQLSAKDIFDLEKMAKYFAICEAIGGYHGITWHNQRFYYNPVTSKLEPIGYDNFAEKTPRKNHLLGTGALNSKKIEHESIEKLLFFDLEFTKHYTFYIQKYTSRSFLTSFFANIEEGLKAREELLKKEFESYSFNKDQLIVNAQRLHSMVLPFNDHSLKAFTQQLSKNQKTLKIANYHGLPIEVIGVGRNEKVMTDTFEQPYLLESFYKRSFHERRLKDTSILKLSHWDAVFVYDRQHPIQYTTIKVDKKTNFLYFKPIGIDSIFYSKIYDWKIYDGLTTRQSIFKDIELTSNEIYNVSKGMVYFKKGKHKVSKSIIIPEGYRVIFEPGCQLDFVKRAKFISKSSLMMNGSEEDPIIIRSSDKTAQGFTILQAPDQSQLHFVEFDQFNTLKERGWSLTGAVTFYESDVIIDRCVFKNNVCEDALNIIRSEFTYERSLISNTYSDGFDADFCKGKIKKARFVDTGNDGMDFSGSVIFITEAYVDNAGDKGLSVGEDSDVSVSKLSVKNSNIGAAAKDLSNLFIENIELEKCKQGFTAYQKKPEYGGANIIVNKYNAKDVKRLYNIRVDCSLQLEDKMIKGERLNF